MPTPKQEYDTKFIKDNYNNALIRKETYSFLKKVCRRRKLKGISETISYLIKKNKKLSAKNDDLDNKRIELEMKELELIKENNQIRKKIIEMEMKHSDEISKLTKHFK